MERGWLLAVLCVVCVSAESVLRFRPDPNASAAQHAGPAIKHVSTSNRHSDWRPTFTQLSSRRVVCQDGSAECPVGATCCLIQDGQFNCCPGTNSVCCEGGRHCCAAGLHCDEDRQGCRSPAGGLFLDWMQTKLLSATPLTPNLALEKKCNDTECQLNDTCCASSSGQACCPLNGAVCCSDKRHCCPNGTRCDVPHQRCIKQITGENQAWLQHSQPQIFFADGNKPRHGSVVCPDGKSECPDGSTCCPLQAGGFGCCPLPNAICCSDHIHCCPHGSTCNLKNATCDASTVSVPLQQKHPAVYRWGDVVCPDQTVCADGQTCCPLATGRFGCCPQPNAVCCSDQVHCCPAGTRCNLVNNTCDTPSSPAPTRLHLTPLTARLGSVICPDHKSECPDGNTCCQLTSSLYGCCNKPNAVCCADHIHCCPQGYKCGSSGCQKSFLFLPWTNNVKAKSSSP